MQRTINIKFFKSQYKFLTYTGAIAAFIGGIGSGKTFTGVCWLLKQALAGKGKKLLALANTYSQLKDVLYPKIFNILDLYGIEEGRWYTFNRTSKDLYFKHNGSIIMFRSLSKYNIIRGIEVSHALIDEARDTTEEAVNVVLGRLRETKWAKLRITTTPAGYNWLYDWYKSGKMETFFMSTFENTHLPNDYIKNLEERYSGPFLRQELHAEFVNFGGLLVYSEFDRKKNIFDTDINDYRVLHIGMDFNINPFCATVVVEKDNKYYVIDEIILRGLDINAMINEIKKRYNKTDIYIYPDASGNNRNVINSDTVIKALQRAFGIDNIKFYSRNPRIYNRVNIVNNWLKKEKILINKKCINLIKDFERVKFVNTGSFEIDKSNKELTHMSDALGYMVHYIEKRANWEQY